MLVSPLTSTQCQQSVDEMIRIAREVWELVKENW